MQNSYFYNDKVYDLVYIGGISQQIKMYFPTAPNNEKEILHILHIIEFHLAHKHRQYHRNEI